MPHRRFAAPPHHFENRFCSFLSASRKTKLEGASQPPPVYPGYLMKKRLLFLAAFCQVGLPLIFRQNPRQAEVAGGEPARVARLTSEGLVGADTIEDVGRLVEDDVVNDDFAPAVALAVVDADNLAYAVGFSAGGQ